MSNTFRRLAVWAAGLPLLLSCGGGEVLSILGYIAPAGGQYNLDANPATAEWESADCGGGDICGLNIQIDPAGNPQTGQAWRPLYEPTFKVLVAFGALAPGVNACVGPGGGNLIGTVSGKTLDLGSCFKGQYESVHVVRSSTDNRKLIFGFSPDLTSGVWVDIRDATRRFVFPADNSSGCELQGTASTSVAVTITAVSGQGLVPSTRISAFTIQRTGGDETWSGEFDGASGLRLQRNGATLELERRDLSAGC